MKISNTSERLKEIIKDRGLKQVEIIEKSKPYTEKYGVKLGKNDLSQYISGKVEPGQDKLTLLSMVLGVSEPWLMGYDVNPYPNKYSKKDLKGVDNVIVLDKIRQIPILGQIACGDPIIAEDNLEGYFIAGDQIGGDFIVRAKGDSMIGANIYDGDHCFIREQASLENGEIGAVLIENEATLKKIFKTDNEIILQPCNDDYNPIILNEDIKILGKLIGVYQNRE